VSRSQFSSEDPSRPLLTMSVGDFCRAVRSNRIFPDLRRTYLAAAGRTVGPAEQASWSGSLLLRLLGNASWAKRRSLTHLMSNRSAAYRADRRRDPEPINNQGSADSSLTCSRRHLGRRVRRVEGARELYAGAVEGDNCSHEFLALVKWKSNPPMRGSARRRRSAPPSRRT
jgi:hypothetical protein